MTNSRVRSTPLFGRASSRSFVWIWYQICGRSRYERISRAASQAMTSSCVMPRHMSRWFRSLRRNISPPMVSQRPDCCQSSAGWMTGMVISCPPMPFISSRMMADDLVHHPLSEGKVHVDPGRQLPHQAGADHELVADRLGVGRVFLQRRNERT